MYSRREILKSLALLINQNPSLVIETINNSNSFFSGRNKKDLANQVINELYNNQLFQKNIGNLIIMQRNGLLIRKEASGSKSWDYADGVRSNKEMVVDSGTTIAAATAAGQKDIPVPVVGAIIGAIVGVTDVTFQWIARGKDKKSSEQKDKQELYLELFDTTEEKKAERKKKLIPVIVVGSVLLVGGIVTYLTLRR